MQLCIRAGGAGLWRGEMQQGEEISKCELIVGLCNENTMRNGRWIKGCGRDGSRSGGGRLAGVVGGVWGKGKRKEGGSSAGDLERRNEAARNGKNRTKQDTSVT